MSFAGRCALPSGLLAASLLFGSVAPSPASEIELTRSSYDRVRALILPAPEELRWREIPWRATFWDGVVEAHAAKRPILLWAMNGHPLGCT